MLLLDCWFSNFVFYFLKNKEKGGGGRITLGGVEGESRYACFFYVFRDGGSISWGGTEKLIFGFDFLKQNKARTFQCLRFLVLKWKRVFSFAGMAVEMNTVVCFCFACTAHQTRKKIWSKSIYHMWGDEIMDLVFYCII